MKITIIAEAALAALARGRRAVADPLGDGAALDPAAARLLRDLQGAAPRQTGAYAATIRVVRDGRGLHAYAAQPLTDWIINGTRPHPIAASSARALFWPGAAHPVARVMHPGTRPNPFAKQAGARAVGEIKQTLGQYLVRRISDVIG